MFNKQTDVVCTRWQGALCFLFFSLFWIWVKMSFFLTTQPNKPACEVNWNLFFTNFGRFTYYILFFFIKFRCSLNFSVKTFTLSRCRMWQILQNNSFILVSKIIFIINHLLCIRCNCHWGKSSRKWRNETTISTCRSYMRERSKNF